jgi:uncharacterized membrane protein
MKALNATGWSMNIRKLTFRALFFPITVFLWLVGWCLYYVGIRNYRNKADEARVTSKKDPLEIIALINEEMLVATDES